MSEPPDDKSSPTNAPAFNPYQAPVISVDRAESPARAPRWQTLWHGIVTVLKGFAYGIIGFQCIILFGTMGMRIIAGEDYSLTHGSFLQVLLLIAVTFGTTVVPVYLWCAFRRNTGS